MLLAVAAAAALAIPQGTWTVDQNNGPGTDFTDLPAAVAAAANGDTIVVRSGLYSPTIVTDKALTIRGQGPTSCIVADDDVAALDFIGQPDGTLSYATGMQLIGGPALHAEGARLVMLDLICAGTTRYNGLDAQNSELFATRCAFLGGDSAPGDAAIAIAGMGAETSNCLLHADRCTFVGGSMLADAPLIGIAGPGLSQIGDAWLVRCDARGGNGVAGTTSAGAGIRCWGGTTRVTGTSSTSVTSGAPLSGVWSNPAFYSPFGTTIVHAPVPIASLSPNVIVAAETMPFVQFVGTSLPTGALLAAAPTQIHYDGALPNAPCFVLASLDADYQPDYASAFDNLLLGPLVVDVANALLIASTTDANGRLVLDVPATLATNLIGRHLHTQAGTFDVATGRFRVSNADAVRFSL